MVPIQSKPLTQYSNREIKITKLKIIKFFFKLFFYSIEVLMLGQRRSQLTKRQIRKIYNKKCEQRNIAKRIAQERNLPIRTSQCVFGEACHAIQRTLAWAGLRPFPFVVTK